MSGYCSVDASGDTPGIQAYVSIGDMLAMLSECFIRMFYAVCCLSRSCQALSRSVMQAGDSSERLICSVFA